MAEYKEVTLEGMKRTRSYRMIGDNPLGEAPSVTFLEEEVVTINGESTKVNAGKFSKTMTDPTVEFPLVDPTTNEPLGSSATFGQVYALTYSLYLYLAGLRDAGTLGE